MGFWPSALPASLETVLWSFALAVPLAGRLVGREVLAGGLDRVVLVGAVLLRVLLTVLIDCSLCLFCVLIVERTSLTAKGEGFTLL